MKKISILLVLLFAGTSFGQQADRWKGLVIDETTPEQAIALLGKPASDEKSEVYVLWFQRLLTNDTNQTTFRRMGFGSEKDFPDLTLTFSSGRLVVIEANLKDTPASSLTSTFATKWRLPIKDPATEFEDWDQPRPTENPRVGTDPEKGEMGYTLLAKTSKVFTLVGVLPSVDDMTKTEVSEAGPYWGNVLSITIVSRTLEKKPGEEEVGDGPIPKGTEVVMAPGSSITAETSTGTITIKAGKGLRRDYTWEGATRSVEMGARPSRWYGSLGLGFPGPGDHWKEHNGITRGVLEEGQMRFRTLVAAMKWINARKAWLPLVYRNDGLLVGFGKNLSRRQLNVEVWQIYINGKKPTALAGSQDAKIR